jgi:hypothetical protein
MSEYDLSTIDTSEGKIHTVVKSKEEKHLFVFDDKNLYIFDIEKNACIDTKKDQFITNL